MQNIGERIKELRLEKGLTQKKLAEIANISEISVRKYESGQRKPKIEVLETFAKIFDVHIDYILGRSNHKQFDLQVISDDFKYLMELIEKSDNNTSKIIRDIIDKMFLTIFSKAQKNDTEYLQTIHKLYDNIWKIGVMRESDILKSILLDDSMNNEEEYEILKNDQMNLLSKLDDLSKKI